MLQSSLGAGIRRLFHLFLDIPKISKLGLPSFCNQKKKKKSYSPPSKMQANIRGSSAPETKVGDVWAGLQGRWDWAPRPRIPAPG